MNWQTSVCSVVIVLMVTPVTIAQNAMLDLVPPEAGAAVAIRSLNDLKTTGDKFLKQSGINMGMRPSEFFTQAYQYLGVQGVVDENGPAVIVLVAPSSVGLKRGLEINDLQTLLVVALPFKDRGKIAGRFGLTKDQLPAGKLIVNARPKNQFGHFFYTRGQHLFMGNNKKAVRLVATGKGLSKELPAKRRQQLNRADLMVHLGKDIWRILHKDSLKRELERLVAGVRGDRSKELTEKFLRGMKDVRSITGAVRIDGGFGLSLLTIFEKDNKAAAELLALMGRGKRTSHFRAVPNGHVLIAQAAEGDGAATSLLARITIEVLLKNFLETSQIFSAAERPLFVGIFNEVWRHLKGGQGALYLNEEQQQHGLVSLVTIFDVGDAKTFMEDMRELTQIVDGSGLKVDPKTQAKPKVDIAKLVRGLGSNRFRIRQRSALQLRLLGEPALVYLEKAMKSNDLETSLAAKRLHKDIAALAAQRRKDLLSQDPFRRIRPTFALIRNAEKRGGHTVHVLRINLLKQDKASRQPLQDLLGPDWNNMRLAIHGNRLVFFLGSDVKLLDKTLDNLDKKRPGFANSNLIRRFYQQSNQARRYELHVGVFRMLKLIDPRAVKLGGKNTPAALSSVGISVEPDRLQIDLWVPIPEVRVIAKKSNW